MSEEDRRGVGVDTSLLQAVDSYLNQQLQGSLSAVPDRPAMEFDPRTREEFVTAIDLFTDTAPLYLVVPKAKRGHLAPLGKLIASRTGTLVEATEQSPIATEVGVKYYRDFFDLMLRDARFAKLAIHWGWFQLLDLDVYLGYTTRMGPPEDLTFVKPEMREQFWLALSSLNEDRRWRLLGETANVSLRDLGRHISDLGRFRAEVRETGARSDSALSLDLVQDGLLVLQKLEAEVRSFAAEALHCGLSEGAAQDLFLLAFVGSVCRRGWQYAEVYTRERTDSQLLYQPHHLRGEFIQLSSIAGKTAEVNVTGRSLYWSWGEILATAIEQRPSRWSRNRLADALLEIRSELTPISYDHSNSEELAAFFESDRWFINRERLKSSLAELQLYSADEDFHKRFMKVVPAFVRLVPAVSFAAAVGLAGGVVSGGTAGSVVAAATELLSKARDSVLGARIARMSYRASEFLEEKWLNTTDSGRRKELSGGSDTTDKPIGPVGVRLDQTHGADGGE